MVDNTFKSRIDEKELAKINQTVWEHGHVDRADLLQFLTLVPTSEAKDIIAEVQHWLAMLHDDPKYDKVIFPQGDINAIIGDLDSYGRLQAETILALADFKQTSNKTLPLS